MSYEFSRSDAHTQNLNKKNVSGNMMHGEGNGMEKRTKSCGSKENNNRNNNKRTMRERNGKKVSMIRIGERA